MSDEKIFWREPLELPEGPEVTLTVDGEGMSDGYWRLFVMVDGDVITTLSIAKSLAPHYQYQWIVHKLVEVVQEACGERYTVTLVRNETRPSDAVYAPRVAATLLVSQKLAS